MSCGNLGENCVCDIVREIVEVQDEIANNNDTGCCSTSCEQSIERLLSPVVNGNGLTTVPFILYCKSDCDPFIGSGVYNAATNGGFDFECVETPVFRAKNFVEDSECCVRLELLLPVDAEGDTPNDDPETVCDFFEGDIENLQATGICLTFDLNCFCGIQCLDPITPLPSSQFLNNNNG